jgi:DNA gyrase subunit B
MFKDLVPSGEDVREGLTAVISVRVPHPQFEGQTKTKLGNSEVEGVINSVFGEFLAKYLEENPRTAKAMVKKGILAAEARESARKARQLVRDRKGVLGGGSLPGKLRDCSSKEVDKCELYLVEGERMTKLVRTLAAMEEAIIALERRGISLKMHAMRQDPTTLRLPVYHVFVGFEEAWFTTREQLDAFVKAKEQELGHELRMEAAPPVTAKLEELSGSSEASRAVPVPGPGETASAVEGATESSPSTNGAPRLRIVELHEVRTINNLLADLQQLGFDIEALIPIERTGEEGSRYRVMRGETETGLEDLRGLPAAIRHAGERGLQITRFKGLGEMNAEELRETTLDPENRTLLRVSMEDAGSADELFRVLMGDNVEPRREFIQKHALDVRNLDV